jgi:signal transduction histidine kinase
MLAQGRQAAIGEMINNIAHQWRQPLNNLGLIIQNIKADYDSGRQTPEELTSDVNKVMETIMFMSQTINDFSSFFSPDKVKKIFYISQGLNRVIAMIEASLSKQGIQLIVEQKEEHVAVAGYFNEYNQVLLNLLSNARDALLDKRVDKPVITIRISREEGQGIVQIRDNAGGIPEEIIGQIFDPYFTTKEQGKGSGVGLYMSKTIIQEHFGGTLTAANVGSGAQFTIATPHAWDGL